MKSLAEQEEKNIEQDASAGHLGFFTIVAVVLLLLCWGWWKTFTMEPPQRFSVLFADIAGLHVNAPVNVNGMLIGSVETLHLEGQRKVRVGVKINVERVRIPVGSKFTILSNGAIGSKYIEVLLPEDVPGAPPSPSISADSIVEGEKTIRVEVVVNKIAGALENVDVKAVDAKLAHSLESLDRAANSVSYLVDSTKPLTAKTMVLEENMTALTKDIRVTN
ncbi:MAG: MlaD family protein, partial [Candidatus Obscuribacterales bacterium]|nr:MlaD family protein [Candidatus Obscuribacterales bacterium]